jgi:hypothetical protein
VADLVSVTLDLLVPKHSLNFNIGGGIFTYQEELRSTELVR